MWLDPGAIGVFPAYEMPAEILVGGEWISVEEDVAEVLAFVRAAGQKGAAEAREWQRFTEADTGVRLHFPARMIDGVAGVREPPKAGAEVTAALEGLDDVRPEDYFRE